VESGTSVSSKSKTTANGERWLTEVIDEPIDKKDPEAPQGLARQCRVGSVMRPYIEALA